MASPSLVRKRATPVLAHHLVPSPCLSPLTTTTKIKRTTEVASVSTTALSSRALLPLQLPLESASRHSWASLAMQRIRLAWQHNSSDAATMDLVLVIICEVLRYLPDSSKLSCWADREFAGSTHYVIGPAFMQEISTTSLRYVIVVEANAKELAGDEMRALQLVSLSRAMNDDGLPVYCILTQGPEWRVLSLGADLAPRVSNVMMLHEKDKCEDAQLWTLLQALYAVFLLAANLRQH